MQLPSPINVRAEQLVSADGGGASFPVGDYPSVALSSQIRQVFGDDQSGLVEYKCQMIDGPYKGATFEMRFNAYNKNPESAALGRRQLASFGAVVGVYDITDTDVLLNKPFISCWRPRKDKPEQNECRGVQDIHGNDPANAGRGPKPGGQPAHAAAPAPAPAPAAGWGQQAAAPAPVAATPVAAPAGWAAPGAPAPAPAAGGWTGGPAAPAAAPVAAPAAWTGGGAPAAGGAPAWAAGR